MPIYTFQCPKCDTLREEFCNILSKSQAKNYCLCPKCSKKMVKIPSVPATAVFDSKYYEKLDKKGLAIREPGMEVHAKRAKEDKFKKEAKKRLDHVVETVRERTIAW